MLPFGEGSFCHFQVGGGKYKNRELATARNGCCLTRCYVAAAWCFCHSIFILSHINTVQITILNVIVSVQQYCESGQYMSLSYKTASLSLPYNTVGLFCFSIISKSYFDYCFTTLLSIQNLLKKYTVEDYIEQAFLQECFTACNSRNFSPFKSSLHLPLCLAIVSSLQSEDQVMQSRIDIIKILVIPSEHTSFKANSRGRLIHYNTDGSFQRRWRVAFQRGAGSLVNQLRKVYKHKRACCGPRYEAVSELTCLLGSLQFH